MSPTTRVRRRLYESWSYAPSISVPTTLVVAERDEIIPRSSSDDLYARFRQGIASLHILPGAHHSDFSADPGYVQALQIALKRCGGLAQGGQQ